MCEYTIKFDNTDKRFVKKVHIINHAAFIDALCYLIDDINIINLLYEYGKKSHSITSSAPTTILHPTITHCSFISNKLIQISSQNVGERSFVYRDGFRPIIKKTNTYYAYLVVEFDQIREVDLMLFGYGSAYTLKNGCIETYDDILNAILEASRLL